MITDYYQYIQIGNSAPSQNYMLITHFTKQFITWSGGWTMKTLCKCSARIGRDHRDATEYVHQVFTLSLK